jgi:glycosyltransferase involved in cell wall biosynthesis
MGLFTRPTLRYADRVVFISERVLDFFARHVRFCRPPAFIANGLDQRLFHAVDVERKRQLRQDLEFHNARPIILFVGRFVEKKGLGLLRQLAARLPEYDWVFVGHGPDDPRDWGLSNIRCDGMVEHEDIARYYQAADLLILPSIGEGFPLVVQEAMACGVPVLVSAETAQAISGVADVVLHTEPRVDSLVDSIRQAFGSPTLLAAKSRSAQYFAKEHWDWEACADRYCEVFEALVGPPNLSHQSHDPLVTKSPFEAHTENATPTQECKGGHS